MSGEGEGAEPLNAIVFDVSHHRPAIRRRPAASGFPPQAACCESYEREEYLLFSGFDESGASLDQETMEKLFGCSGQLHDDQAIPAAMQQRLNAEAERHAKATVSRSLEQNSVPNQAEAEKADDMALSAGSRYQGRPGASAAGRKQSRSKMA
jgi:hypothetical protein